MRSALVIKKREKKNRSSHPIPPAPKKEAKYIDKCVCVKLNDDEAHLRLSLSPPFLVTRCWSSPFSPGRADDVVVVINFGFCCFTFVASVSLRSSTGSSFPRRRRLRRRPRPKTLLLGSKTLVGASMMSDEMRTFERKPAPRRRRRLQYRRLLLTGRQCQSYPAPSATID